MNILDDNPIQISTVKMATVAATNPEELAIFVAPYDCYLNKIYMTDDAGIGLHNTVYSTFSFVNKGIGGAETDEIASIANGPTVSGSAFVARVPKDVGALHITRRFVPEGVVVTYKKTETATGVDMTDPLFSVEYVRA
jgi:hypothetical protein